MYMVLNHVRLIAHNLVTAVNTLLYGHDARYVKSQGNDYLKLHTDEQLTLFWFWYPVRLRRGSSF